MKIVKILPMTLLFTLVACDQLTDTATEDAATPELSTLEQKVSYLMGMQSAASTAAIELDKAAYDYGFADGLADKEPALSEEVIAETVS